MEVDLVEIDARYKEVGEKYFGFESNQYDKWYFEDARSFIKSKSGDCLKDVTKRYDMIIIDINNLNTIEGISPPPDFFEEANLGFIHVNISL